MKQILTQILYSSAYTWFIFCHNWKLLQSLLMMKEREVGRTGTDLASWFISNIPRKLVWTNLHGKTIFGLIQLPLCKIKHGSFYFYPNLVKSWRLHFLLRMRVEIGDTPSATKAMSQLSSRPCKKAPHKKNMPEMRSESRIANPHCISDRRPTYLGLDRGPPCVHYWELSQS